MTYFYCYKEHNFRQSTLDVVERANEIIADMARQGYVLTLRQLYYQFVRRNWIANKEREYKRLGSIVTDAREAGLMDWLAIEDRGRTCYGPACEEDPTNIVRGIDAELKFDHWARQDHYVEVWVEKQALENVIARSCDRLDVRYMACKGYLSASEAWRAGLRFQRAQADGKAAVMIHLADHDPSGLDMTEDNRNRIHLFAESHDVRVRRLALNMDQVEEHRPPPNPAKVTDSRFAGYQAVHGNESWELDALNPSTLDDLITSAVEEYIDRDIWDEVLAEEDAARRPLAALSDNWDAVREFLEDAGLLEGDGP